MKTSIENVSTLQRKLNIHVPVTEVQAAFDRAFQGIQRNVTVKGFRKGKAPISAIKSIYGDRVKQDVIQDIVQSKYAQAVREHSLDPINYPTIEFDPLEDDKDFQFTAEFEVRPEVKIAQIEGLPVKKEKWQMTEALVDSTIEDIRKSQAAINPVLEDRLAESGDIAVVDFKGFVDGKELENGAAENHHLELGTNSFIPGFEEGVIGMRPGVTATLRLKFPTEYHVKDLADKDVEFQVRLKELKKKVLPEVNDEFAKTLGPYDGLAGLRQAIRDDFEKREGKRINDDVRNRLLKALVDRNPVHVPNSLMQDQKKALIEDFEKRMQQQGMTADKYEDYKKNWDKDFEGTASYMIQSSFLIDQIAADKGLRATGADLELKFKEFAQQSGIDVERVKEFYKEDERKSRLAYQITEEKVLDYLLSTAKIDEVSREQLDKE